MRLFIIGSIPDGGFPYLPDDFTQIFVKFPVGEDMSTSFEVPVVIVATDPTVIPTALLEVIQEVVQAENPWDYMAEEATEDDLVFMDWDSTDAMYERLSVLVTNDVEVYDMSDNFKILEIGDMLDLDRLVAVITKRVTKDVLRVLRSELAELINPRRTWQTGRKV